MPPIEPWASIMTDLTKAALKAEIRAIRRRQASHIRVMMRLRRPTDYFMLTLRRTELARLRAVRNIAWKCIYAIRRGHFEYLSQSLGAHIPLFTLGTGASIAHLHGIVINGEARIGKNCRLHQGVTIGAVRGESPVIGDNVFIGPNAVLLGPITVGHNARIYAGVVLTKSLPATTAAYPSRPYIAERDPDGWNSVV